MDGGAWYPAVHGVAKSQTRLSDFTFTFPFHTVASLRRDDEVPDVAERGTWVTFPAPRCRVGDKVFFVETVAKGRQT